MTGNFRSFSQSLFPFPTPKGGWEIGKGKELRHVFPFGKVWEFGKSAANRPAFLAAQGDSLISSNLGRWENMLYAVFDMSNGFGKLHPDSQMLNAYFTHPKTAIHDPVFRMKNDKPNARKKRTNHEHQLRIRH